MVSSMLPENRGMDTHVVALTAFNITVKPETAIFWDMTY